MERQCAKTLSCNSSKQSLKRQQKTFMALMNSQLIGKESTSLADLSKISWTRSIKYCVLQLMERFLLNVRTTK